MSEREFVWQERRLEEILFSNTDPVNKVQQIIRIGFDAEIADEIVEQHQRGMAQPPVYYERLDFADLEDEKVIDKESTSKDNTPDPLTSAS